ncbi:hypothetical protein HY994_00590 [Candidatus Micrarchaeota archaeon]|nr:hypothetical protein [Candidatus Micrarchaeota archaeon]
MEHGRTHQKSALLEQLPLGLTVLVLLVALYSLWQVNGLAASYAQKTAIPTPAPLPVLRLTQLVSTLCSECWSPNALSATLAGQSQATTETISAQTPQGQELVKKYGVTKAPTLIVTGQTNDSRLASAFSQGWKTQADARIFVGQTPVYFNPVTYEMTGKVTFLQVVDPSCSDCADLSSLGGQLKKAGVYLESERTVNSTSVEGVALVQKYAPAALPFIILSKDASAYSAIADAWRQIGTVESDGSFIFRQIIPPFRNMTSGRIDGRVSLVELEARTCTACYDVSIHEKLLANFGIKITNVSRFDINGINGTQGKSLVVKYNVTQLPTVLVSSEASVYPSFVQVWPQVGTREADGTYVFRNLAALPNVTVVNVSSGGGR